MCFKLADFIDLIVCEIVYTGVNFNFNTDVKLPIFPLGYFLCQPFRK